MKYKVLAIKAMEDSSIFALTNPRSEYSDYIISWENNHDTVEEAENFIKEECRKGVQYIIVPIIYNSHFK